MMWAQVGRNKIDLGFKSYTCYCAGFLDKGLIARTEASKALLETKLNKSLITYIIAKWLGSHQADELHKLIIDKSYKLLTETIKTPIALTMICLLVERCSLTPQGLNNLALLADREKWLYTAIEELIQYPLLDRLDLMYTSIPGGALELYIELATFHYDLDIIPESLILEVIEEYIKETPDISILNSVDEAGILIKVDKGFTWSDASIKDRLSTYSYKQRQWARANKLSKQIT